ncbi:MAG: GFA family protein [Alphaproteobacteria bacterium]
MDIKGGCLCGAVRYSATVEQAAAGICHCRDCQRFTGSAFAALVVVPKAAVTIDGAMTTFSSPGGSGQPLLRHFCPQCGSSLAEESPTRRPGMLILNVGTFDDPAMVMPMRETFRDDAWPWLHIDGDIPRFAKRPT